MQFSLDAVRVSKVNNPGNLEGLAAVKPGSTVWLMMYYTVGMVPSSVKRITTYTVQYKGKTIFQVTYKGSQKTSDVGRFSRYTEYSVPAGLPYGHYVYRAALTLGRHSVKKSWKFQVAKQERVARRSGTG